LKQRRGDDRGISACKARSSTSGCGLPGTFSAPVDLWRVEVEKCGKSGGLFFQYWENIWENIWEKIWEKIWENIWEDIWEDIWENIWEKIWEKYWENIGKSFGKTQCGIELNLTRPFLLGGCGRYIS